MEYWLSGSGQSNKPNPSGLYNSSPLDSNKIPDQRNWINDQYYWTNEKNRKKIVKLIIHKHKQNQKKNKNSVLTLYFCMVLMVIYF